MKNLFLFCLLSGIMSGVFGGEIYSVASPKGKLLLHWNFDSLGNMFLPEEIRGYSACLSGSYSKKNLVPGLYGKAFAFHSGKVIGTVPHAPELSLNDDFTIEAIFRPTRTDFYHTILWKGNRNRSPEAVNYHFGIRSGNLELKYKDKQGHWIVFKTTGKPIVKRKWYHCSVYYKHGICTFTINGQKKISQRTEFFYGNGILPENDCPAQIGAGTVGRNPGAYFEGDIDDLKIWQGQAPESSDDKPENWHILLENYRKALLVAFSAEKMEAAEMERRRKRDYTSFFAKFKCNDMFGVVPLPDTRRLNGTPDFFRSLEKWRSGAEVYAARNEYEGGQLIFFSAPGKTAKIDSVIVSDLINDAGERIPASSVSIGKIGFVTTGQSGIPVEFTGRIPDPIYPGDTAFDVKADEFTALHYRIYTGNAAPGIYRGTFHISESDGDFTVPLTCRVFNFKLPERSSLKTVFSFDMDAYRKWFRLDSLSPETELTIHNFLLDYRICGAELYGKSLSPALNLLPELKHRITTVILPAGAPENTYEDVLSQVKTLGLDDRLYFYAYDELADHPEYLPEAEKKMAAIKRKYPALRRMQTSFPIRELAGMFDVWCPLFIHFGKQPEQKKLEEMKAGGTEIWWYPADLPEKPYPNFFVDFPVFDCRIIGTLSFLHNVDGLLYWRSNREWLSNLDCAPKWQEDKWRTYIFHISTGDRKYRNGMGNLVYPGRNGELLPSLRLENLRDGLEDYEYLAMLKRLVAAGRRKCSASKELRKAEILLSVPAKVAQTVNSYSDDPVNLMRYREQVAHAIEALLEKIADK